MQKIGGIIYVKGSVDISEAALARLKEMGVVPPKSRFPQWGEFESFFLPEGEEGKEFSHKRGSPSQVGYLALVTEAAA